MRLADKYRLIMQKSLWLPYLALRGDYALKSSAAHHVQHVEVTVTHRCSCSCSLLA